MDILRQQLGDHHMDSDNEDWNETNSVFDSDDDSVFDSDSDEELVISDISDSEDEELVVSDDSDDEDVLWLDSDDEREGSDRDEDCCDRYHYGGQYGCDLCLPCADIDNPEMKKEWLKGGKYCYRLHKAWWKS